MINFDSLTLKALTHELSPILIGGRIQKVQQPSRKELLLNIRACRASHKLYISIDPKYAHIAIMSKEGEVKRNVENSHKPPMFCMLLRKHMEGAKILEIKQPNHERILELYFESYGELGERTPLCLAIELMGKHSNIILYNRDTNTILGCAHNVSSEKSREREVAGTLPYIYPPALSKADLLSLNQEQFSKMAMITDKSFSEWLNQTFYDVSYALANEVCRKLEIPTKKDSVTAISEQKIALAFELLTQALSLNNINPSISADYNLYSLIAVDDSIQWQKQDTINEMVDDYFSTHIQQDNIVRVKSSLNEVIKRELKRNKTKIQQHLKSISSVDMSEQYRQLGDIVMANLYKIKPGMESVTVENPYNNNEPEDIKLDPTIGANANAQKYYKKYNKAKNAARISKEILVQLEEDKDYLDSVSLFIKQASSLEQLAQLRDELESQNIIKKKQEKQKKKKEMIELDVVEISGLKVYIGKNNKQNDYLVSKFSSPNDIWLHAHEMPSSHVLIKVPPENIELDEQTIYEAAKIVAKYSQAKDALKVPVIYTRRKFLKKPPAAKPGYVIYSNEKMLIVNQGD